MYLLSEYQVNINVSDPIGLYLDRDENLMTILREQFEGKCKNGNLIMRIIALLRVGDCIMNSVRNAAIGSVSITFSAIAISYRPRDIISAIVSRIEKDCIYLTAPYVNAMIVKSKNDYGASTLTTNTATALVITNVDASQFEQNISLSAVMYEPKNNINIFPVNTESSNALSIHCYAMHDEDKAYNIIDIVKHYMDDKKVRDSAPKKFGAYDIARSIFSPTLIGKVESTSQHVLPSFVKLSFTDIFDDVNTKKYNAFAITDNELIDGYIWAHPAESKLQLAKEYQVSAIVIPPQTALANIFERYIDLYDAINALETHYTDAHIREASTPMIRYLTMLKTHATK